MSADADDLLGQKLASQFQILKKLGAGGMGAVYLAEQTDMARRVVIKVMHPELTAGSSNAVERFKREARAVAALNHPHIVQVFVFGQAEDGRLYLAMEFVEGRDLAHELKRGPMAQGRTLKILDQVAAALTEAHSHGIVHRDLKPENIMLADRYGNPDWVKVLDFGIAKLGAGDGKKDVPALTQQGAIFGTPRYMAPEQVIGGTIDARTDLYSLGVILYEMLSGEHPFRATSQLDFLMKHVQEPVVRPNERRPELGLHPRVEQLLVRLLEKDQDDRFQSAAELQREVRAVLAIIGDAPTHTLSGVSRDAFDLGASEPAGTVTVVRERAKGKAWLWVALAVLAGGGAVAAVVAAGGKKSAPEPVALLTTASTAEDAATAPVEDATVDDAAGTGGAEDAVAAADSPPASGVRAGRPIEGFPAPEGTQLVNSQPGMLTLESSLSARALFDFYRHELAGRVRPMASGLEFTDPASPWTHVVFTPNADRIAIYVGRRADLAPSADEEAPAPDPGGTP